LWISFDIDAICSNEFESTGTAEANGISMEFINKFFLQILKENVIGIDISEINFSKTNDSRIVKRD
jgi:arginase family enzyme